MDSADSSNVFVESEDSQETCLKDMSNNDKRGAEKSSVRSGARSGIKHASCSGINLVLFFSLFPLSEFTSTNNNNEDV